VLAALCVTMCAPCVKNIFLRIYKLFGTYYSTAQVYCSQQVLDSRELTHCKTYVLRRNRFNYSWTAVGRAAIRLKKNDWREMKELNLQR